MSTLEKSKDFAYSADECYQGLLEALELLDIRIPSEDDTTRQLQGYWMEGLGARFTIRAECIALSENTSQVKIAYDPKWSPFWVRPLGEGKSPAVAGKIDAIFSVLAKSLASPDQPVDLEAIEAEVYRVQPAILPEDNWFYRLRKRMYGRSPFVSGFLVGFAMSIAAAVASWIIVLPVALCLITGGGRLTGGHMLAVGFIQLLAWAGFLIFLLRVAKRGIKTMRLYQPSTGGLVCGIGLYLICNLIYGVYFLGPLVRTLITW
jgi:hypothetical protein